MGFWEILLQHIHLQEFYKLICIVMYLSPQFLNQKCIPLYDCHNIKCCIDCPHFACQIFIATIRKNPTVKCLEKRATTLEKCPHNLWQYDPWILCRSIWTVWIFFGQKIIPNTFLDICAWKTLYDSLGMHSNTLQISCCCLPKKLCTLMAVRPLQIRTVWPVLPCCLLPWKLSPLVSLGCVPLLQMLPLLKAQPLSFSLFLSKRWLNNNPS